MTRLLATALAGFIALGGASAAQAQTERDLSVQQTQAYSALVMKPAAFGLAVSLDRADATYALGESVGLTVKPAQNAYITVWSVGASGQVVQLFPNAFQKDNYVRGGRSLAIPDPKSGSRIKVSGPVGAELIKVVATSKPFKLVKDGLLREAGDFALLDGGSEVLARDLAVVASAPPSDLKVAAVNLIVKTIPARSAAAPVVPPTVVVAPPAAPPPTVIVTAPVPAPGFPLLLAADKASYRTGEAITLGVTPLKACHLSVIAVSQEGRMRQVFPLASTEAMSVAALQTVLLSGGPSGAVMTAGAPGTDTLIATCTSAPRKVAAVRAATDILPEDQKSSLERDLAIVIAKPDTTYGQAKIAITVTP